MMYTQFGSTSGSITQRQGSSVYSEGSLNHRGSAALSVPRLEQHEQQHSVFPKASLSPQLIPAEEYSSSSYHQLHSVSSPQQCYRQQTHHHREAVFNRHYSHAVLSRTTYSSSATPQTTSLQRSSSSTAAMTFTERTQNNSPQCCGNVILNSTSLKKNPSTWTTIKPVTSPPPRIVPPMISSSSNVVVVVENNCISPCSFEIDPDDERWQPMAIKDGDETVAVRARSRLLSLLKNPAKLKCMTESVFSTCSTAATPSSSVLSSQQSSSRPREEVIQQHQHQHQHHKAAVTETGPETFISSSDTSSSELVTPLSRDSSDSDGGLLTASEMSRTSSEVSITNETPIQKASMELVLLRLRSDFQIGTLDRSTVSRLWDTNLVVQVIDQNTSSSNHNSSTAPPAKIERDNAQDGMTLSAFRSFYRDLLQLVLRSCYSPQLRFKKSFFFPESPSSVPLENLYRVQEKIAQGRFGVVWKAVHRDTGIVRCVKKLPIDDPKMNRLFLYQELYLLRMLDHPNVVRLIEAFDDNRNLSLIFELVEGHDLYSEIMEKTEAGTRDTLKEMKESRILPVIKSVLEALAHCHDRRIIHKDLKPDNILIVNKPDESTDRPDCAVRIIDFGLSQTFRFSSRINAAVAGTPYFMAPEAFGGTVDSKCDIWAVGILMYLLLSSHLPFNSDSKENYELVVKQREPQYPSHLFGKTSSEGIAFLKKMLNKDPTMRPTATEALRHPWLTTTSYYKMGGFCYQAPVPEIILEPGLFRSFAEKPPFHRICYNVLASLLDPNMIPCAERLFKAIDLNCDGRLSEYELSSCLRKIDIPIAEVPHIIDKMDVTRRGCIAYSEFVAVLVCRFIRNFRSQLVEVFRKMDHGEKGYITRQDFHRLIHVKALWEDEDFEEAAVLGESNDERAAKRPSHTKAIDDVFYEMDKKRRGYVQLDEFQQSIING